MAAKTMNTVAAIEAVKILAPALPRLRESKDIPQVITNLTSHFLAEDAPGFIRFLALMWGADPEEVKAQITRKGEAGEGAEAISMLLAGLKANPILELFMAGADLGMLRREEVRTWLNKTAT